MPGHRPGVFLSGSYCHDLAGCVPSKRASQGSGEAPVLSARVHQAHGREAPRALERGDAALARGPSRCSPSRGSRVLRAPSRSPPASDRCESQSTATPKSPPQTRRRARKAGCGRVDSPAEWLALPDYYDRRCGYCGDGGPMQADHRVPLVRGGEVTVRREHPSRPAARATDAKRL